MKINQIINEDTKHILDEGRLKPMDIVYNLSTHNSHHLHPIKFKTSSGPQVIEVPIPAAKELVRRIKKLPPEKRAGVEDQLNTLKGMQRALELISESKNYGIPADATLDELDDIAKNAKSKEKRDRAHWLRNMRRGKNARS